MFGKVLKTPLKMISFFDFKRNGLFHTGSVFLRLKKISKISIFFINDFSLASCNSLKYLLWSYRVNEENSLSSIKDSLSHESFMTEVHII